MVTFVFTNPGHHLAMMLPVAQQLAKRGERVRFVSLAELRGMATPDVSQQLPAVPMIRVLPRWIRKDSSTGASIGMSGEGVGSFARKAARELTWRGVLGPQLRWHLRGSDVVVIPNDAAFPYDALAERLKKQGTAFALLQEGIRFPLPTEQRAGIPYGSNGASAVCVWGDASAEHFTKLSPRVCVTGNPRWDGIDPASWEERGFALMKHLKLATRPLLYLSNTVDDQGFCTNAEKMQLFADFLAKAAPAVSRHGRSIVVKLHGRESVADFRAVAANQSAVPVHVLEKESLFETLAMGQAAVVLASTVGLEALAFGLPLGVLALPRHGHVFEYVSRGVAIGLDLATLDTGLEKLLSQPRGMREDSEAFVERHFAHRGQAASRIADQLQQLQRRPS